MSASFGISVLKFLKVHYGFDGPIFGTIRGCKIGLLEDD